MMSNQGGRTHQGKPATIAGWGGSLLNKLSSRTRMQRKRLADKTRRQRERNEINDELN